MSSRAKTVVGCIAVVFLLAAGAWFISGSWSKRSAIAALDAEDPTDAQIELIAGLLADQTGTYRGRAESRLRELGTRSVPALLSLSKAGKVGLRATGAQLAAEIDPDGNGFDGLEALVEDPDIEIRRAAAEVLSVFATPGSKMLEHSRLGDVLRSASDDENEMIRGLVASSLEHVRTEDAEELLQAMTEDSDRTVARHASQALKRRAKARRGRR